MLITTKVGKTPAVALVDPKYPHNVGAAVRAASCFGVPQIWWSGERVHTRLDKLQKGRLPREERMRGYQEVEMCQGDYFFDAFGPDVTPIAVELRRNAESLMYFQHPERALYVFGPEDSGLGKSTLTLCHRVVQIPSRHCLNLAGAVYTVLYDRHVKRVAAGLEEPFGVVEERGFLEPDSMIEVLI